MFYFGASVHRSINNDYTYTGAPFLMGTVALGNNFVLQFYFFYDIRYESVIS